jgi:hypothetical protein
MKTAKRTLIGFCILMKLIFLSSSCNKGESYQPGPVQEDTTIVIPPGDVTVACYYFPNWGPLATSEWNSVRFARPKFSGHQQPKVPLWGYENEKRNKSFCRQACGMREIYY